GNSPCGLHRLPASVAAGRVDSRAARAGAGRVARRATAGRVPSTEEWRRIERCVPSPWPSPLQVAARVLAPRPEDRSMTAPPPMPAAFLGHGSPMNALERNRYTAAWRAFGASVPRPRAILAVSAHWYVNAL